MIILYNCPIKICLILKCGKIFFEISPEFGRSQLSFDFEEKSENRTNLQPARNWSTDVAVMLTVQDLARVNVCLLFQPQLFAEFIQGEMYVYN
jgi:hypothetical protein